MSLLSSFGESMTPDTIEALGKAAGLDGAQIQQGLGVIGPLLLGGLAKKSQTTSGLDSIMRLLPEDSGGGLLSRLVGPGESSSNPLAAASALSHPLGPGASTIGKAFERPPRFQRRAAAGGCGAVAARLHRQADRRDYRGRRRQRRGSLNDAGARTHSERCRRHPRPAPLASRDPFCLDLEP
jgi:hypothetical protein